MFDEKQNAYIQIPVYSPCSERYYDCWVICPDMVTTHRVHLYNLCMEGKQASSSTVVAEIMDEGSYVCYCFVFSL